MGHKRWPQQDVQEILGKRRRGRAPGDARACQQGKETLVLRKGREGGIWSCSPPDEM